MKEWKKQETGKTDTKDTQINKQETLEELKELEDDGELDEKGILEEELASEQEEEEKVDKDILASLSGKTVYRAKIVHSNATVFCICNEDLTVKKGDFVIVPTRYGRDLGKILGIITNLLIIGTEQVHTLQRKATGRDLKLYEDNKAKDTKAFNIC